MIHMLGAAAQLKDAAGISFYLGSWQPAGTYTEGIGG